MNRFLGINGLGANYILANVYSADSPLGECTIAVIWQILPRGVDEYKLMYDADASVDQIVENLVKLYNLYSVCELTQIADY